MTLLVGTLIAFAGGSLFANEPLAGATLALAGILISSGALTH